MTPTYAVLIFLVLFAIVLVAISLGYRVFEAQRKKQVKTMLDVVAGSDVASSEPAILIDRHQDDPLELALQKAEFSKKINRMIQQSGLPWTVSRLVAATLISGAAGAAIGLIFKPLGIIWASMLVFGFLFGWLPYLYLKFKRNQRMDEFESQLPEALDFLARSMRAGHAFSISLEMLGQESPDPLGQEFRVLFNEINLGAPVDVALGNLAERVPQLDVKMFVSSVLLQKQTGGNLSEILVRLAYVIRERFRLRGQVKAASAHGRMTSIVLTILPIVLVVALMFVAPGYLQSLANDSDGKWLIAGAVFGQILGYFVMRKIVNIKV